MNEAIDSMKEIERELKDGNDELFEGISQVRKHIRDADDYQMQLKQDIRELSIQIEAGRAKGIYDDTTIHIEEAAESDRNARINKLRNLLEGEEAYQRQGYNVLLQGIRQKFDDELTKLDDQIGAARVNIDRMEKASLQRNNKDQETGITSREE